MIATALKGFDWWNLRLTRAEVLRMFAAGTAWGVAMSVGLAGMTFWNYGMICRNDIVMTTVLSVAAGILTIGPLAAYGRRKTPALTLAAARTYIDTSYSLIAPPPMNHDDYSDVYIRGILNTVKTIAMVGISAKDNRPSYFAFKYLQERGYRMIPVNPGQAGKQILGQKVYAKLTDIPDPVDMVDIFRASAFVLPVVEEALALKPRPGVIWMQLGIRNDAAAALAEAAGVKVVMNRCPKIEYGRLSSEISWIGVNSRTLSSKKAPLLGKGVQRMSLNRTTMSGGTTDAATRAQKEQEDEH